jgi:RNA exonuclease 1
MNTESPKENENSYNNEFAELQLTKKWCTRKRKHKNEALLKEECSAHQQKVQNKFELLNSIDQILQHTTTQDTAKELSLSIKKQKKNATMVTTAVGDDKQMFFRIFGKNAKPQLFLKIPRTQSIRVRDVQELLLWILADGVDPSWIFLKHKVLIQKVVVVILNSLSQSLYQQCLHNGVLTPQDAIPCIFPEGPLPCRAPGSETRVYDAIPVLLNRPLSTKESAKKKNKSQNNCNATKTEPEEFLLTLQQMKENNYPLPGDPKYAHYFNTATLRSSHITRDPANNTTESKTESTDTPDKVYKLLAIDCEMCSTTKGMALARVSVVDDNLNVIYDALVKPQEPIVDYLTEYSGITEETLKNVSLTHSEAQKNVLKYLNKDTILIGHSLENDLHALQIIHTRVVDTAILYPNIRGERYKYSLKYLSQKLLGTRIQSRGHDSIQDAMAAMRLAKLKFDRGPQFSLNENETESIFVAFSEAQNKCCIIDNDTICRRYAAADTDVLPCIFDSEVLERTLAQLKKIQTRFIWAHFRDLEKYYFASVNPITASSATSQNLNNSVPADSYSEPFILSNYNTQNSVDMKELYRIVKQMNDNVGKIYDNLPENSLFIVMSGTGNMATVKRLIIEKQAATEWTEQKQQDLQCAIQEARNALLFLKMKSATPQQQLEAQSLLPIQSPPSIHTTQATPSLLLHSDSETQ